MIIILRGRGLDLPLWYWWSLQRWVAKSGHSSANRGRKSQTETLVPPIHSRESPLTHQHNYVVMNLYHMLAENHIIILSICNKGELP